MPVIELLVISVLVIVSIALTVLGIGMTEAAHADEPEEGQRKKAGFWEKHGELKDPTKEDSDVVGAGDWLAKLFAGPGQSISDIAKGVGEKRAEKKEEKEKTEWYHLVPPTTVPQIPLSQKLANDRYAKEQAERASKAEKGKERLKAVLGYLFEQLDAGTYTFADINNALKNPSSIADPVIATEIREAEEYIIGKSHPGTLTSLPLEIRTIQNDALREHRRETAQLRAYGGEPSQEQTDKKTLERWSRTYGVSVLERGNIQGVLQNEIVKTYGTLTAPGSSATATIGAKDIKYLKPPTGAPGTYASELEKGMEAAVRMAASPLSGDVDVKAIYDSSKHELTIHVRKNGP